AGCEVLDRRAAQRNVGPIERLRGDVADILENGGPAPERPGRGECKTRADEFASFHGGSYPGRTVLLAARQRTNARIANPMATTITTSRTDCHVCVAIRATQAAR